MWRDLVFTLRNFKRQPMIGLIVVITLAMGIGGSTSIFSVFNAVLLRDLPYHDPDRLYVLNSVTPDGQPSGNITPVEFRPFYEAENHPLVEAAALAWSQKVQIQGSDNRAYSTTRYGVTDQFFEVFGSNLYLGQAFERGQHPGVIVMAYPIWRDVFASDPEIIGKPVVAEGTTMKVVGVTKPDFEFPEKPGYWYLMNLGARYDQVRSYRGFFRLRKGVSEEQLQSEVNRIAGELPPEPVTNRRPILVARPFLEYIVGDLRPTVVILFGATAILLLIACINITNLLLSRMTVRSRETALREALGAGRWRLFSQLLTESILLSVLGGALGFACATIGLQLLLRTAPPNLPRLDTVPIDTNVLLFAMGITLLTGLLTGLAPAWRLSRNSLNSLVNEAGRGTPGGAGRTRLFSALVVAEVALAVFLVIGSGLLVRSYFNLAGTDSGFSSDRVLTLFFHLPYRPELSVTMVPGGEPEISASYAPVSAKSRELTEKIQALPGVDSVGITNNLPLDRSQYGKNILFNLPDLPGGASEASSRSAYTESISPDFFLTLDIRLLSGRTFQDSDRTRPKGVAVVNKTFIRHFLEGREPLGQRIRFPENYFSPYQGGFQLAYREFDEFEIIGVVEDVKYRTLAHPPEPRIYASQEQWPTRHQTFVVRTLNENPETLIDPIRRAIASVDRDLTAEFAPYSRIVYNSLARERLAATLLALFGLIALVMAAVGIYGLMSYSVAQRTGEIAVRAAMGASARQILTLVMGRGIRLALGGIIIGIFGAVAVRKVVASQLYGVSALDTGVFVVSSVILFVVAVIACFVPAQRAARVHPADLLRIE